MNYLSVCSGIEAATVAWHPLGWNPVAFSEIEAFPRSVLKHHYPDVPLFGDFTEIQADELNGPIDLLVGGTPCQSFSVAGLRGGMDDDRGNLALEFCRLALRTKPRWIVWENVPGVLSSNEGRDFGSLLGALAECGYGFAYRVLDAQFVRVESHEFAVPQRRRRVFVVGYLGDWRRAASVLFERESVLGHPSPSREARKDVAGTISSRPSGGGGGGLVAGTLRKDHSVSGNHEHVVASPLRTRQDGDNASQESQLVAEVSGCLSPGAHPGEFNGQDAYDGKLIAFNARQDPDCSDGNTGPLDSDGYTHAIAIQERAVCENPDAGPGGVGVRSDGSTYTLEARPISQAVLLSSSVRRLMPIECERLQGFPDGYTAVTVTHRKKPACDGPRYKAIGNSMAVNVMSWIGQRIKQSDGQITEI